jgi:hypothetical protein
VFLKNSDATVRGFVEQALAGSIPASIITGIFQKSRIKSAGNQRLTIVISFQSTPNTGEISL